LDGGIENRNKENALSNQSKLSWRLDGGAIHDKTSLW
jgi:hypothetical protein